MYTWTRSTRAHKKTYWWPPDDKRSSFVCCYCLAEQYEKNQQNEITMCRHLTWIRPRIGHKQYHTYGAQSEHPVYLSGAYAVALCTLLMAAHRCQHRHSHTSAEIIQTLLDTQTWKAWIGLQLLLCLQLGPLPQAAKTWIQCSFFCLYKLSLTIEPSALEQAVWN